MKRGERILTLEKIYNLLHTSFDRKDDFPPENFMREGIKTGPFKGEKLEENQWNRMLTEYYALHHWDPETGFPKEQILMDLELAPYIGELKAAGKVAPGAGSSKRSSL
jgi:aldehyde:ferredoxin oxidoreductase